MTAWIKSHWNFAPAASDVISADEWAASAERPWISLSNDSRHAMAQIICALTRPHNPGMSLRYIKAFANGQLVRKWGSAYPSFVGAPRKKRSEIDQPFLKTDDLLKRALLAGGALQLAWERARFPVELGAVLAQVGAEVFDLRAEHSMGGQAVDELPPSSDVRKKLWSDFIPVIHIAMAMREVLRIGPAGRGNIGTIPAYNGEPVERGALIYSLLFHPDNAEASLKIADRAEDIAYQIRRQELLPRPERLVALRRFRDWRGDFSPALAG